MKKSIIKSIALFLIILISILFGYENPELIESTKSIFKEKEKTFEIDEEKIEEIDTDSQKKEFHIEAEIKANSFSLKLLKVKTLPDQSASLSESGIRELSNMLSKFPSMFGNVMLNTPGIRWVPFTL